MKTLNKFNPLPFKSDNDNRELWRSEEEIMFEFYNGVNSMRQYYNEK